MLTTTGARKTFPPSFRIRSTVHKDFCELRIKK